METISGYLGVIVPELNSELYAAIRQKNQMIYAYVYPTKSYHCMSLSYQSSY